MREEKIDIFLNTFRLLLEGALACLNNGRAFNQKINEIEQCLLNASPSLVSQLARQSIDIEQAEKVRTIIALIEELELKSNAKLDWFQDLDRHLKRTLANDI